VGSQETTINMVDTNFETLKKEVLKSQQEEVETLKKEVEVLKSQQEEVEKLAELLSKQQNELKVINNEVITMLMRNHQELEALQQVDNNWLLIKN